MMDLNGYVQAMKKKRELEMMLLRYNGELINEKSNIKRNQAYLEYYREQKEDYENEMDGMLMLDSIKEKHLKLIGQVNQYQQLLNESKQMESKLVDTINQMSLELKSYDEISKQYNVAFQERLTLLKEKDHPEIETIERFIEFSKFYAKLQFNYKRAIRLINELKQNADDLILFYDQFSVLRFNTTYNSPLISDHHDLEQLGVRVEGYGSRMEELYQELENRLHTID